MITNIDPRLSAQFAVAGDEGEVEAVYVLTDYARIATAPGEPSAGERLVERISQEVGERPTRVRYLPKLGVLYVRGKGKLLRQILEQEEVSSASSSEADITVSNI